MSWEVASWLHGVLQHAGTALRYAEFGVANYLTDANSLL